MDVRSLEGYEDEIKAILRSFPLAQRIADATPEQLAACLTPEQRLAGLDRDHQALALPLEVIRVLPEDYLRSLSPEIQAELRRRLRNGDA